MARVAFPVLLLFAITASVVTYNTITMVNSYHQTKEENPSLGEENNDGDNINANAFDPLIKMPEEVKRGPKRLFHVAVTANDSPYNRWQCRIMYYWYKKFKDEPGSEMGGFTRVLHLGKPDGFMEEIPTFVVDPLPDGEDRVCLLSKFSLLGLLEHNLHSCITCAVEMFSFSNSRCEWICAVEGF